MPGFRYKNKYKITKSLKKNQPNKVFKGLPLRLQRLVKFNCSTQEVFELRSEECEEKKLFLISFISFAKTKTLRLNISISIFLHLQQKVFRKRNRPAKENNHW